MRKQITLFALLCVFISMQTFAQDRTLTGKVTSSQDNLGIPGASVVVVGTTIGTTTDIDGNYKLNVPANAKQLKFSGVGLKSKTVDIGSSNSMDMAMDNDVMKLDEVVVTALGIAKEKKRLTYAVQELAGDEVSNVGQQNVVNSLAGKVAGATVTSSSGSPGASSFIVLRGPTSILGNNQPLFVVDGVPFNNDQVESGNPDNGANNNLIGNVAFSNRAIDINPDDIESVTVLKGPAASALYGINASAGAIIITTKKGRYTPGKKVNVSFSSGYTWDVVNKTPELQDKWVKGSGNAYRSYESTSSGSWGPLADTTFWDPSQTSLYNKNGEMISATDAASTPGAIKLTPFDNVDQFFRTGGTWENSLAFSGGGEKGTYRASFGTLQQDGIVPLSNFNRYNIKLSGDAKISNKFSASGSVTYANSGGRRVQQGSNLSGLMLDLLRTPISFDNSNGSDDPSDASAYLLSDGTQRNYRAGLGYDNPYWTINQNPFHDDVNRMYGYSQLNYVPTSWLSLFYRIGTDFYSDRRKQQFAIGSRAFPAGQISEDQHFFRSVNGDLVINAEKNLTSYLNASILLGHNFYSQYDQQLYTQGDGLAIPDFYNIANASTYISREAHYKKRTSAYYGELKLDFWNMLYLSFTGRNELSSTLPEDKRSFFYPSASAGFVFTEALHMSNNKILPYGKVRLSYAIAGKDADPYSLKNYYNYTAFADGWTAGVTYPFNGVAGSTADNVLGNPNLKPEKTKNFEAGLDLRFLKNRVGVDFTYYNSKSEDLLLLLPIAGSTGYADSYLNAAKMENNGIEVVLNLTPVQTKSFRWDIMVNYAKNNNKVTELAEGIDNVFLGGFEEPSVRAATGESYGTVYGGYFITDGNGKMIIDDDPASGNYGYPIASAQVGIIGKTLPDWTGGLTNTFSYKGITLSATLYTKQGGEIWNGTKGALTFFGRSKLTENRGDNTVFEGVAGHVDQDGNVITSGTTNSTEVALDQAWYQGNGGGFGSVSKPFMEDGSFIKLRELSLTYSLNTKWLKKTIFQTVDISFIGRNLWLKTDYTGVDPETSLTGASNSQGMDYFNMPSTKSYGVKLNVNF